MDSTPRLGILHLEIIIEGASLKEKRSVLRSLKDRIRNKFNVSVSELDNHDKWQHASLGIAAIGNCRRYIDSSLQEILSFIENQRSVQVNAHEIEFL